MNRTTLGIAVLAGLVVPAWACSSNTTTPTASTTAAAGQIFAGPGGTSLKADPPAPQSPANNTATSTLTPTLVVAGGGLTNSTAPVQYRFRIINDAGTVAADSGLVSGANWTPTAPLTPTSRYTWMARSEYQGLVGPWSISLTFTTPVAPGNDYGAWESSCQGRVGVTLVTCVWNFVRPTNAVEDLEVAKRVAWLLRSQGGGLLLKSSGETTAPWLGFTFSASRICFPDGHIYKIIGDAGPGGANTPGYSDNDFVDVASYFPARDPRLR